MHSGGGIEATAIADGEMQRRSFPNSFRGHIKAAGWEHIRTLGLIEEAERTGSEAVELLRAPECPSEVTTLILDSGQVELQVHESIGHPIELDRVLGMEEAYAGSSFLTPEDRGKLRYGEPARLDHGRRHARRRARLVRLRRRRRAGAARRRSSSTASSRTSSPAARRRRSSARRRNGTMRADGWQHLPLIRMTNISLEPREGSLAEIIGDTKDGIFMATNQSWSIDDKRINFQFGCEIAWRIEGRQADADVQEPELHGDHAGVLGLVRRRRRPRGVDACGARRTAARASPDRSARVGHGTSPARFRNVQVGVR